MGDNSDPGGVSGESLLKPRSEPKSMSGQKRGIVDVGERSEFAHKRAKLKDLGTVFASQGVGKSYTESWINRHVDISRANKETETVDVTEKEEKGKGTSQPVVGSACVALDLNAKVDMASNLDNDTTRASADNSIEFGNIDKSKHFGIDLNVEDVSSSADHGPPSKHMDQLKDDLECGSSCGPLEEKDSMKVWKEMKQNGFMSSSHGGVPIPKPRGRKSKSDVLKKKMEIARREQVDRFAKVAAPSGLLNGLNPGIINHVRNSKQVHSIIEALVRSERRDNIHTGSKEENIQMKTERTELGDTRDRGNMNFSEMKRYNLAHEDGSSNNASRIKQISECLMSSENIRGNNDSSMNISTLCDEDSADFSSVSSLSFKAANVATQWLELLQQDIKGRLGALRRSKKRVRAVIETELPLLLSREFSHNQENDPYVARVPVPNSSVNAIADMHKARWSALFNQMDSALSDEERHLESWLNQVKEMQMHTDRGLSQCTGAPGLQQPGLSETGRRIENPKDLERVLAVRAAAAAFYSTCNFSQSVENLPRS